GRPLEVFPVKGYALDACSISGLIGWACAIGTNLLSFGLYFGSLVPPYTHHLSAGNRKISDFFCWIVSAVVEEAASFLPLPLVSIQEGDKTMRKILLSILVVALLSFVALAQGATA